MLEHSCNAVSQITSAFENRVKWIQFDTLDKRKSGSLQVDSGDKYVFISAKGLNRSIVVHVGNRGIENSAGVHLTS